MVESGYKVTPHLYKFEEYSVPQAIHRIIIVGICDDLNLYFKIPAPMVLNGNAVTCKTAIENPPIPSDAPNNQHTRHTKVVIERLKHIRPGENAFTADLPDRLILNEKGAKISQIYKRLDPEKPAYTVTGSRCGAEPRVLTNQEFLRMQCVKYHE